jgi:hypothetical protein
MLTVAMPKTPRGHTRPPDVISNAVHVMRIAVGEIDEPGDSRNPAAVELGRKGGRARAKKLGKAKRVEIARRGAAARHSRRRRTL